MERTRQAGRQATGRPASYLSGIFHISRHHSKARLIFENILLLRPLPNLVPRFLSGHNFVDVQMTRAKFTVIAVGSALCVGTAVNSAQ